MDLQKVWKVLKNSSGDKDMQRAFNRAATSNACIELLEENETLQKRIVELEKIKDELHDKVFRILSILGIYPDFGDIVCNGCDGIGKKVYANTSTYLKGIGGQSMTDDICDECWGSGKSNAPFRNLRELREQAKQIERGE